MENLDWNFYTKLECSGHKWQFRKFNSNLFISKDNKITFQCTTTNYFLKIFKTTLGYER